MQFHLRRLRGWLLRLFGLFNRTRRERDFAEELESHLAMHIEDNLRAGMSPQEARRQALIHLGGVTQTRERHRQQKGLPMLDTLLQDLRFGLRMLRKNPGFSLVAIFTLAAGIGANTAIFSVVNALLLRPLPYRQPEQLVKVFHSQPEPTTGLLPSLWSYPRFALMREGNQSFAAVAGFNQSPYNLTGTESPERLQVEMVSASYFPLLGVDAGVGRAFIAAEDATPEAATVAVLGYGLWQRRFGGDVEVIGRTMELDKQQFTIVGVLPQGFRGQSGTADVWLPMAAAGRFVPSILRNRNDAWFQVIARLRDSVTIAQAEADLQAVGVQIEQQYPSPKDLSADGVPVPALAPLQAAKVDPALKNSFLILLIAVALVLLIACANVANLLLARAVTRQREFALRAALGASRRRLLRQLLVESLLLALLGGTLGVLIAYWGLEFLQSIHPSDNTQFWTAYARTFDYFTINLDGRVLGFNFAVALFTGLLFGTAPALQASFANVNEALKEGAGSSSAGVRGAPKLSARSLLVVGEIALSLLLLISAGLMLKSLLRLHTVDLGFEPEKVLMMTIYARDAKPVFYEELLARVQALPGVEVASFSRAAPLYGQTGRTVMDIEGREDIKQASIGFYGVSPDYFQTLGIALRRGRVFTEQDRVGAPRVAIINQTAADRFFPGLDPIGKRLRPYVRPRYETAETFVEIVGVVADVRYGRLEEAVEPDIYVSALQPTDRTPTLLVRSSAETAALIAAVRAEVLALDSNVPLTAIQTMPERVAEMTSRTRFIAIVLGLFAVLALLLAGIGIYGVMAYSVSARRREVGIRIALGAQRRQVLALLLRQGAWMIAVGLTLGIAGAWAATRSLRSFLHEVSATDPLTFVVVAALLSVVALSACWLPARRATKIDPLLALRHE